MSSRETFADGARRYYEGRFEEHGATPAGADWNSAESQELRFTRLLELVAGDGGGELLDYGCGYGALLGFMREHGDGRPYRGYDISAKMVEEARGKWGEDSASSFTSEAARLEPADYAVASGVFNVKGDADRNEWGRYVLELVLELDRLGRRGFAFNALTIHSDAERRREDLYYADPAFFLELCQGTLGRQVSVRDDYGLYEFTVIARGEVSGR